MSNYIQPDFRIPATLGTVQPHQPGSATGNPLNLTLPISKYVQVGISAPALLGGQLTGTPLGQSKHVFADGHASST